MTTREKRIAELDEQRRCLEQLTEDDVGRDVWVRDDMELLWSGPYWFQGFDESRFMFAANGAYWLFATKTPPIEPQKITLRRWDGGQLPAKLADTYVVARIINGEKTVMKSTDFLPSQWEHTEHSKYWITHYAPIEIEVEE